MVIRKVSKIMDCENEVVMDGIAAGNMVAFVDLHPNANWAHPCLYIEITKDGSIVCSVIHRMPPHDKHYSDVE